MNLTDKEKFHERICESVSVQEDIFSQINKDCDSYLESICEEIVLNEYSPDSKKEFETLFDTFCDVSVQGEKIECTKKYFKEYIKLKRLDCMQTDNMEENKKGEIPTFIYTF